MVESLIKGISLLFHLGVSTIIPLAELSRCKEYVQAGRKSHKYGMLGMRSTGKTAAMRLVA
jgi:hypothetical protein